MPHKQIDDVKVASNNELLKLLKADLAQQRYMEQLVASIEEDGLTFSERDFVTKIVDRISKHHL